MRLSGPKNPKKWRNLRPVAKVGLTPTNVGTPCAFLTGPVESRSGAVTLDAVPFPDPAHQTGRADFPHRGFRTKVQSCFRPREVARCLFQSDQPECLVEILVGIGAGASSLVLVFGAQPLSQPISAMGIHRAVGFADRAKAEIVAPARYQRVEFPYLFARF